MMPGEVFPMKIAFLGLGAMGYPMAANLSRHHEVTDRFLIEAKAATVY